MRQIKDISTTIVEPFGINEAKDWLRVTDTESDYLIDTATKAAREHAEQVTGLSLIDHSFELFVETSDSYEEIDLSFPEIKEVTKVESVALDGTKTELVLNSDYNLVGNGEKYILIFTAGRFIVTYSTIGYVPLGLKPVLKDYISALYDQRPDAMLKPIIERMRPYRRMLAW